MSAATFRVLNEGAFLCATRVQRPEKSAINSGGEHADAATDTSHVYDAGQDASSDRQRPGGTNNGAPLRRDEDRYHRAPKVAYAVLSFGGFMGIGVKHIPVPWDRMKYAVGLDAYEINLSDEELSRVPSFEGDDDFDWGYRDGVIANLNFYRTPPY